MFLYLIIFLVAIVTYYSSFGHGYQTDKQKLALVAMFAFLALFVGFSDMLGGYDRYIYGELFDDTADMVSDLSIISGYPAWLSNIPKNMDTRSITC